MKKDLIAHLTLKSIFSLKKCQKNNENNSKTCIKNMTQEEKQLLLKDLCARLPYGVMVFTKDFYEPCVMEAIHDNLDVQINGCLCYNLAYECNVYLRPMSSMTDEEREEYRALGGVMSYNSEHDTWALCAFTPEAYDWLNKKQFDYRGLISMGFALEAPEDMYNTKNK